MVVMYHFCFWFTVRLGSIIVGAVSLLQAIGGLVVCSLAASRPEDVSSTVARVLENYELLFVGDLLTSVKKDPGGVTTTATVFMAVYTFSCLLLIYAAYKCNWYLALPFVGLDFARLVLTTVVFVVVVMVVKENILDLGVIIGAAVIGGFVLLYLFYMWFCTVAYCQMVRELDQSDNQRALIVANIKPAPERRWKSGPALVPDYARLDYRGKHFPALPRPAY